jgi:hypothetical protein
LGNIEVQALKASYTEGRRVLKVVQWVQTNDLGEYRLFWLAPGRYYVMAAHPQAQFFMRRMMSFGTTMIGGPGGSFFAQTTEADPAVGGFRLDEEPQGERYVPVYFSGAINEGSASAIDLRAGSDVGGVNIVVAPVLERHVRGIVVDGATGRPAQYGSVKRAEGSDDPLRANENIQVNPENGSFDITLLPGSYSLIGSAGSGSGYATIRVSDSDIENLTIVAMPALNVTPDLFSPGRPPALRDAYVKSIRLGSVDVLNTGLHLERPPAAPLDIVLGTNPGTIDGTVVNETLQVSGDVSVALLPDVRRRTDLYKSTTTDPSGRFRFEGVPPGDYKLFAWVEVESDAWYDSDFMSTYENRGKPVRVAEGSKQEVQVTVIPAP